MALNLMECPHCSTTIVPNGDGECPSCRYNVSKELTPEQAAKLAAVCEPIAEHEAIDEIGTINRTIVFMAIGTVFIAADFIQKLDGAPSLGFIPNWMNGVFVLVLTGAIIRLAIKGRMLKRVAQEVGRKNCPNCGREVSTRAPSCPKCEHRFVRSMPKPPE